MAKYVNFSAAMELAVIDSEGKNALYTQSVGNPALMAYMPDEDVVIIDWSIGRKKGERPTQAELRAPITVQDDIFNAKNELLVAAGTVVHGDWAWGSAAKSFRTFGITRDIGRLSGMMRNAQDGLRFGRWMLPNAIFGAVKGAMKVRAVPVGTMIDGVGLVEDGFGYVKASVVAEAVKSRSAKGVARPDNANDSTQITQMIPWTPEVKAESLPLIDKRLIALSAKALQLETNHGSAMEQMKALTEAEPLMIEHPYVAHALARSQKADALRFATTIPMGMKVKVAVPTTVEGVALRPGKWVVARYPVDSYGAVRAVAVEDDAFEIEIQRIENLEVVQYTLANEQFFAKGQSGVVADELMGEYDLIICQEDVKMAVFEHMRFKDIRQKQNWDFEDVYYGLTMHYSAGCACGVSAKFFKNMGGDHDGDFIFVGDLSDRPATWGEIAKFPEAEKHKLPKDDSPLTAERDVRARLLIDSMANIIGMATNLRGDSFLFANRAYLADMLGFRGGVKSLDSKIGRWLEIGQNIFKVDLGQLHPPTNVDDLEKEMKQFQTAMSRFTHKGASWNVWPKNDDAFKHMVPEVWTPEIGDDKDDPRNKMSVHQSWDGTVAKICAYTLPNIANIVKERISAAPLSEFRSWADKVSDELLEQAKQVQVWYNSRVTKVNWAWDKDVAIFNSDFAARVESWSEATGLPRKKLAHAMWRAAHDTRSLNAGAASVFTGFPEEALDIVRRKPGLHYRDAEKQVTTIVLGLKPDVVNFTGKGIVQEYTQEIKGQSLKLKCVVLQDSFKMKGAFCAISRESEQPELGLYTISFERKSNASWTARFVKVE